MASEVSVAAVRDYLTVTGTTGQWSPGLIGSNINAAHAFLQRRTNRQFEVSSNIRLFSTWGRQVVGIPDLRSAVSVTLNGAVLTENESFYLLPDRNNSGVSIAIEFPAYRHGRWSPGLNTFDVNYRYQQYGRDFTLPNNLAIDGHWGHLPQPDEFLQATKVLAAYWTIRPDALLSGVRQTAEGNIFDLSRLPPEIGEFITNWRIETDAVVTVV